MKNLKDPMWILSIAVLIGVVGMGVATMLREDQQMSAEEIALLSAIVGAVAGSSLPRSARGDDDDEVRIAKVEAEGDDLSMPYGPGAGVDPGLVGVDEQPDFGADDDDWFEEEVEVEGKPTNG